MKQRDLLFAGLLLFAAPAFAQDGPTFDPAKDAKVVFTQDFEADWKTWTTTAVDTIFKIEYYDQKGESNGTSMKPWEEGWKRGLWRDSLIVLYNGVVVCDEDEDWFETPEKNATIIRDSGAEKIDRYSAMAKYGEADGGGNYYFKFMTDSAPTRKGSSSYSNGRSARYRRNLFVRGLDIEDNSSYRLTFYVKGKVRNTKPDGIDVDPALFADVMRGYFHAEKPFSMGYINDAANYKYTNAFEYTKDYFNGDWEKVTFMTYYQNDTVANNYVFVNGYWWADGGAWTWPSKDSVGSTNPKKYDLNYHVQPDKFFVRIGFASDYTEFSIDNMSLTKSFIGGVEYYQDMLRVDFGYETNLKDLARDAYAKTRIDAVELPGKYFEVWGLKIENGDSIWEPTDIATAEYQGDGYMYMFTDTYEDPTTHEIKHYTFEDYDKILVSFTNPAEKELQLKYTGSTFPKANDIEWIKAGKLVPNFYNEVAQLNPNVFAGVYSMNNRPPVMQEGITAEEGSFGLDGNMREIKFKFSHKMDIDNPSNVETRKKCIVYVGEEIWDRAWTPLNAQDPEGQGILTLTRPAKYTTPLAGDIVVEITNLFMPNTDRKGDDVAVNYNFGTLNRDLSTLQFAAPFWDAKFYDTTANPGDYKNSAAGTAIAYTEYYGRFVVNDGTKENNASRLYRYTTEGLAIPRAIAVCPRNDANNAAKLYLGHGTGFEINLTPGNYVLRYKAQPINKIFGFKVYIYPWMQDPRNIPAADKQFVSDHRSFDKYYKEDLIKSNSNNVDTILTTQFDDGFSILKGGRYLIEVCVDPASGGDGGYPSMLFSNFELCSAPVCFGPISALNNAVADAQARVALAADAKYAGAALTALEAAIAKYKDGGTWQATGKPSDWSAATTVVTDATAAMKLRMDTVDLVVKKIEDVAKKLKAVEDDTTAVWTDMPVYKTLKATKGDADAYNYSTKSNADLTAFIKRMDDEIKAVDTHMANVKKFADALNRAKKAIDEQEQKSFTEYGDLKDAYDNNSGLDAIKATSAALTAALAEVTEALEAYQYTLGIFNIGTRRIKELAKMADDLGTGIKDSTVVKERFENLKTDDDYLAAIYMAAIKAAIYADPSKAPADLTPFIKNYYLYATAVIDNPTQTKADGSNLKDNVYGSRGFSQAHQIEGSNIVRFEHAWNTSSVWCLFKDGSYDNLFPGWTVTHAGGSGNQYVTPDSIEKTSNFLNQIPVYDGAVSLDWGSTANLTSYVLGLPAGDYELSAEVWSKQGADQRGNRKEGQLSVRPGGTDEKPIVKKFTTGYILEDTILVENDTVPGQFDKVANSKACDSTEVVKVNFTMKEEVFDAAKIMFEFTSSNGKEQVDNFKLTFKPQASYSDSVKAAAKAEIAKVITVVDFTRAQVDNVEYYTLGGLKVDGVKPGQILIRKTTGANGKVKVDKVLLK